MSGKRCVGRRRRRADDVEIVYRPAKRIIILDYFQFSKDALAQMFARLIHSGLPVMAQWAEGVLFIHFPLNPETNDLMDSYLKGEVVWNTVNFALMPKYSPFIKVAGLEVPVINVSDHPILRKVAKWLKQHAKEEK